jgi:serine/threonine-protein kinase RsbW
MTSATTIVLRNQVAELERVGQLVAAFGAEHGLPSQVVFDLTLALDEILTNVMSYGYTDEADHEIVVRLSQQAGTLVAEVEDDGRPFNPLDVPPPDLDAAIEDRPIGGLGLHLVRRVSDGLDYERAAGKNRLVLRKTLPAVD